MIKERRGVKHSFLGSSRGCGCKNPHQPHLLGYYPTVANGNGEYFCKGVSGGGLVIDVDKSLTHGGNPSCFARYVAYTYLSGKVAANRKWAAENEPKFQETGASASGSLYGTLNGEEVRISDHPPTIPTSRRLIDCPILNSFVEDESVYTCGCKTDERWPINRAEVMGDFVLGS